MAQILMHGTIFVTIFEMSSLTQATSSSTTSSSSSTPKRMVKMLTMSKKSVVRRLSWIGRASFFRPKILEGIGENVGFGKKGASKLYATIDLDKARVGRTRMVDEGDNPRWYESFHIYCAHTAANVIFTVKSDNRIGAVLIGRAYLPVTEILIAGQLEIDRWLDICSEDRVPLAGGLKIHVKLRFLNVLKDGCWGLGIRNPKYPGVAFTYFPQRKGCKLSLYQDAHVSSDFIPRIPLANGMYYEPKRCWEDIYDAICNAKYLIYIAGWSIYTEVTLVRDPERPKPGGNLTLGELLKKKADQGIRVLVLVWDDRTSVGSLKKDGLMATHDEETYKYFEGTNVNCLLCARNPDDAGSYVQGLQISTMFTHHQKIVIVDSEMPNKSSNHRRIVSFIGGIDLCDGRYDSQNHSLFGTLNNVHQTDFHQPNFPSASLTRGGPREPWHDAHCKLEGPVAWDVLFNFEQRWIKQGIPSLLWDLKTELSEVIIPPSPVMFPEDTETWNVQFFRSIDGGAAFGFPERPEDAVNAGLVSGKDHIIDRSIQDGYINAIRRARKFIYIENQYFLGSSFGWKPNTDIKVEDIGALHLIPKEISLKIVSKIEAGERFTVFVVIPMWPEGVPESASVQAILDWQRRTMEMMYTDIVLALRAKSLNADPKDYLTFYCLGNREVKMNGEYVPHESPEPDSDYLRAQEARRFMIYVHTKIMIVDDEYIIIGSANINQRSMDGARDTEIAVGAYQPHHLTTGRTQARGQIHGFRMALWYEHLRMLDDALLQPESLQCVQLVNKIARNNWDLYAKELLQKDLPGHLLSYPFELTDDGGITELPGFKFFPDTNANVLGGKAEFLPPILTT